MSGSTGSVVNAGDGNDPVLGSNGADTIDGGNGNDTIGGFAGNDSIFGGQGDDRIDGGDGADIALGGLGNDLVQGGNGDDSLSGENGADTLTGGAGADTILGDAENDSLSGGIGNDSLLGGAGTNSADYLTASGAVTVDLVTGRAIGADGNDTLSSIVNIQGGSFADNILGDSLANMLAGGAGNDTLAGGANNDSLSGGDGNDSLSGGDGDDTLNGGDASSGLDDTLTGGAGNDFYIAPEAVVFDTGGSDTVSMLGGGVATLSASAGDLDGNPGIEAVDLAGSGRLLGLTAAAVISISDNDVLRVYGSGNDSLVFEDAGWVRGETAGGLITFTNGGATVMAAQSLVPAASGPTVGSDTLTGASGADAIDLLAGNDSYLGFDGNDSILGNDGNDTIYGGNGADSIAGGNDNDLIYGEAGSDTIDAGAGTWDSIRYNQTGGGEAITATITSSGGNTGINTATVSTATQGTDSIQGFEGLSGSNNGDLITVTTAATQNTSLFLFGSVGNDTIIDNYRVTGVFADYNTPSTFLTSGISVDLTTGAATDGFGGTDSLVGITAVNGTSFADTMLGSASNDRFRGWQGNDLMDGRGGTGDMVDYGANVASQAVSVNLATGRANDGLGGTDTLISIEQVRATSGSDTLIGGNGNELLRGNGGNDSIDGGNGSDIADYSNNASNQGVSVNLIAGRANDGLGGTDTLSNIEYVFGGSGNDTIIGGNGAESFLGNSGDDSLVGSDGADTLYGGFGNDTIAGGNGNDVIYGEAGSDTIDAGAGTFDVIRYNQTGGEAITANISLLGPNRGGSNIGTVATATQGTDSIVNFEYINGSANNDTFNISDATTFYTALFLFGSTGNDTITSSADLYGPYSNVFADYDVSSTTTGFTRGVSVDLQTGTDTLGRPIGSATDYAGTDMLVGVRGISATSLNDTIYGTAFDDRFRPYAGNDIMDGRDGFDMVDYSSNSSSQAVSVNLVTGRADDGRGGADTLASIEAARGGSGNDTLLGNVFAEAFRGLAGNDSIDGGLGSDRIEYFDASATSGVSVNLITGTASDGRGGIDTFTSIENAYGGELNDYLVGVGQNGQATSRLRGDAGSDTLVGIDGEYVVADYGTQTVGLSVNLASGSVNDGMGGVDVLINIRGAQMYGNFADTLIGSNEDDWLAPSGGNDSIVGGNGFDIIAYGGNPTMGVSVNLATGTANDGDGGTDAFTGIEAVLTGYSNDTVIGDSGFNAIGLGAGADYADAAGGNDVVSYRFGSSPNAVAYTYSESGDGRLFSGVTIDLAAGRATDYGNSVDTILNFEHAEGSSMNDSILGSSGDNELDGWEGNDTIDGGAGNDTIWSDEGDDRFLGGAGNDLYLMAFATGSVTISDISGNDTVSLSGAMGVEVLVGDLSTASGIDAFNLAGGGNTLHLNTGAVRALSETDLLRVYGSGDDNLIFDDPSAWTRGATSGGFVTFTTSSGGNATVIASQSLVPSLTGGPTFGDDALDGTSGMDAIDLLAGNDTYLGLGGDDSILGNDGADSILGGDGADIIVGGSGVDTLDGGEGNDTLSGSAGPNRLLGGIGSDFYHVINTLDSVIENLSAGTDTIMTSVDLTLPANVEMLGIATGVSGITVTGGAGGDTLIGNGLSNTYNGGAGDDVILVGTNLTLADLYALFPT
jgi:Ca2+-binding RTX toxin-like protein